VKFKHPEQILEMMERAPAVNRRSFLKANAAFIFGLLASGSGLTGLSGCGYKSDWKKVSFPKVLLHNFQLFDGINNRLQEGLCLLIDGDRIQSLEIGGDLAPYKDRKIIDLKGMTLLPGLIDNHAHITVPFVYKVNLDAIRQMNQQIAYNFRNCILNGVTTIRDVGGFPGKILKFRELSDQNEIPGPRVISSLSPIAARKDSALGAPEKAPYFTNPILKWFLGGNYAERPTTTEEIKEACERMVKLGAQWLKTLHQAHSYSYYPRPLPNHADEGYRAILEMGRQHGIKCALHQVFLSGFKKGVDLGFHTLDHMPMDGVIPDEYIEKFMEKRMAIMPTMMVYGDSFVDVKILEGVEKRGSEYLVPEAIKQISGKLRESIAQENMKFTEEERRNLLFDRQYWKDMFPNVVKNLQKLYQMGATVGVGTDLGGTYSGFFGRYHDELKHYASAGISNFDTLRMATAGNARIIDMEGKIGTIEKGKFADLIAVEGNPLQDLSALEKIRMVIKGGIFMKGQPA
jgi:imidazolonepropionase-like amidohydrolase